MSHSFIDRSSNYFTQNYENEEPQKKIDPIAQLKEINNTTVREWGPFNNPPAQMFARDEEEEKTQAKIGDEEQQQKAASGSTGTATHLPSHVQAKMESSFGTDFSGVNIHANSGQATNIGALAYTQGNDVHFAPGQFNPDSQKGQELIGHELTHVVQQRQGRVRPDAEQYKSLNINSDTSLEKEADVMGTKAAQGESVQFKTNNSKVSNKIPSASSIQKVDNPTAQDYKNFTDFKAMTLYELDKYANKQADWYLSPSLSGAERDSVREILSFTREENIIGNCGAFIFNELYQNLIAVSNKSDVLDPLRYYAKVAASSDPFLISRVNNTNDGVLKGQKLQTLISGIPSFILKTAMYDGAFEKFVSVSDVQKLVDYYQNAQDTPFFQSSSKRLAANDFGAYTLLNTDKYPLDYDSTSIKDYVRSYHRFEKHALDKLVTNFGDTSKLKPLTIILHSAIDHNGAFIRDPKLSNVITNANLHVLMVEGKEKVNDYKSTIEPLAKKYGQNDKIDQVMFAGHGNSQSIELGGKIEEDKRDKIPDPSDPSKKIPNPNKGKIKEVSNSIDVKNDPMGAQAIFDEVLDNMNLLTDGTKEPHRRILFNACLTNSNSIPPTGGMGATAARTAIQNWLTTNKNLVDTVLGRVTAKGSDITKVVGSVASHGQLDMYDAGDNLDLISSYDPQITAPNKIDYVKAGQEPTGVLRAVHELWSSTVAIDVATLKTEITNRSTAGSSDWRNVIIESIFKIILQPANWADSDLIRAMQFVAGTIDHCRLEQECKVNNLSLLEYITTVTPVTNTQLTTIFNDVTGSDKWSSLHYIPTVFYQVWMAIDTSDVSLPGKLTSHLNTQYADIKELQNFIDVLYMNKNGMFAKCLKNKGNFGEIKLALIGALKNNTDSKSFLMNELVVDKFPATHNIDTLLGGVATELDILEILGVYTPPTVSAPVISGTTKDANLTIDGGTQNTLYVDSVTKTGTTKSGLFSGTTTAYKEPSASATVFGEIAKGTQVYIVGSVGEWWAIEYTNSGTLTTAFVKKSKIKL